MDAIRQSVMINQFISVTGCDAVQAQNALKNCNWNLEGALSLFFTGQMLSKSSTLRQPMDPMCAPANTPATPPNFSEITMSLAKMNTASQNQSSTEPSSGNITAAVEPR